VYLLLSAHSEAFVFQRNSFTREVSGLIACGHSGCRGGICVEHVVGFVRHKRRVPDVGRRVATDGRCQPAHRVHSLNERGHCESVAAPYSYENASLT
jgi:hypothetical protein